jgi:hypothetical protein
MLCLVQAAVLTAGSLTLAASPDPGTPAMSASLQPAALTLLAQATPDACRDHLLPDFGPKAKKK